jgi:hypothetical protein
MGRIGMSQGELRRVGVLARVKSKELNVGGAASLVRVSYRQVKRLWKRYHEEGDKGLKHRSAGRVSARAKPEKFRRRVMKLVHEKYGESEGERFGATLAAEHLASEDGCGSTRRRCGGGCWRKGCGGGDGSGTHIYSGERDGGTLASWCGWTEVFTTGWRSVVRTDAYCAGRTLHSGTVWTAQ